jgi:hypothetical protein
MTSRALFWILFAVGCTVAYFCVPRGSLPVNSCWINTDSGFIECDTHGR